jgi:hypothetical protein
MYINGYIHLYVCRLTDSIQFLGAMPGKPIQSLKTTGCSNPLILIDEVCLFVCLIWMYVCGGSFIYISIRIQSIQTLKTTGCSNPLILVDEEYVPFIWLYHCGYALFFCIAQLHCNALYLTLMPIWGQICMLYVNAYSG